VSHARDARRKGKHRQARVAANAQRPRRSERSLRPATVIPILAIVATLAGTALLGLGGNRDMSRKDVGKRVSTLLSGIPQMGATVGFPYAPLTLRVFADLECPTVKRFVDLYLPKIVNTWVRDGKLKLVYRSLKTDTADEATFFDQEAAALAAGRQGKMWNFVLTFVHEQGQALTHYATDKFYTEIASQIPELDVRQWQQERKGSLLPNRVALSLFAAKVQGFRSTPSFVLDVTGDKKTQGVLGPRYTASIVEQVETALREDVERLNREELGDVSTLRLAESVDPHGRQAEWD
jgi:protein-disulfide isomerase